MQKLSKSAQRRKEYDDAQIARAVGFTAQITLSPKESHKRECRTKQEAFDAAIELNQLSEFGRRACVYAITPEGFTFPVDQPAIH